MVDINGFRNAMALLGGAVSVITTDGPAGRFGFTASAVCSVTDSPHTLGVYESRLALQRAFQDQRGCVCQRPGCQSSGLVRRVRQQEPEHG